MRQQRRLKVMTDMTKKIKAKGRMDANNGWWVSELLAADGEKAWLHARMRGHNAAMVKLEDGGGDPKVGQSNDQECRRRNRYFAQKHQTNGVEKEEYRF